MSYKDDGSDGEYDSKQGESKDFSRSESKTADEPAAMTKREIVHKVQEYIFGNEELAKKFEKFIEDRSNIVDFSDEYKLEYTAVFNEYKELFEVTVEGFIENELHVTIHDFYQGLKSSMEEDEDSNEAIFAQILIAMTDFDIFMTMMREAARNVDNRAGHK